MSKVGTSGSFVSMGTIQFNIHLVQCQSGTINANTSFSGAPMHFYSASGYIVNPNAIDHDDFFYAGEEPDFSDEGRMIDQFKMYIRENDL